MNGMECGCGKPVRYITQDQLGSCNKYFRCKTYDQLLADKNRLTLNIRAYGEAVNQIDDYFEYRNESVQDRKKVHQLLGNLTDKSKEINYD